MVECKNYWYNQKVLLKSLLMNGHIMYISTILIFWGNFKSIRPFHRLILTDFSRCSQKTDQNILTSWNLFMK
jgi:hypothetical protein